MAAAKSRRGPLRLVLLAATGIVVLGVAGLVVAQAQLSPDRLREALQRAVRRSTGRELTIAGNVHFTLGLAPSFVVDGISLANAPGGSQPQMFTAHTLRADIALLPLLSGDAVIESLTVDQPDILLERLPDGTPNWQPTTGRRALYQGAGSGGGGGSSGRVEVHRITLKAGRLRYRDAVGGMHEAAIDTLVLAQSGEDSPVRFTMDARAGGAPFRLDMTTGALERLQGGPASKLEGAWPVTADLSAAGASLHLEGGVAHPDQLRGYKFKVHGDAQDVGALSAFAPGTRLPALKSVTFSGTVADGTEGDVRTSQLMLAAGESDLSALVPGVTIKHLDFKAPGPGQIAQLAVDGSYDGAPLSLAATAMQPDSLTTGAPVQVTADAQAAQATASVHGTVPASRDSAGLDLQVALKAADLSLLSPFAGRPLPAMHDLNFAAHATDAGFRLRGVSLGDIAITSSMGDLSGGLTLEWSPRLVAKGTLKSNALDADALAAGLSGTLDPSSLPSSRAALPAADAPAPPSLPTGDTPGAGWPLWQRYADEKLPLVALRAADFDLVFSAGSLTAGGQHFHDLDTHMQLADGKLAINPFRVAAPQGAIVGGSTMDASTDTPPVAVTLRSAGLAAPLVARALGFPGGANGSMQLDAQLSGTGDTPRALAGTLAGHVGLAMVNGDVDNALIEDLAGGVLRAAGAPSLGGGRSQVRCLALRVNLGHGRGSLAAFGLDTSRLAMTGTGNFGLADGTLDLHLRPRLRLGVADASAPVSVRGSVDDPHIALDPVLGGGRVGITLGGSGFDDDSGCVSRLALARGGAQGPMPAAAPADPGLNPNQALRKLPTDLLRGLFH